MQKQDGASHIMLSEPRRTSTKPHIHILFKSLLAYYIQKNRDDSTSLNPTF